MLDWLKIGAAAVAGALLISAPVYLAGRHDGRVKVEAAAMASALERIEKMGKENATFKTLPAHDRCVLFMRDSGLPIDACGD